MHAENPVTTADIKDPSTGRIAHAFQNQVPFERVSDLAKRAVPPLCMGHVQTCEIAIFHRPVLHLARPPPEMMALGYALDHDPAVSTPAWF